MRSPSSLQPGRNLHAAHIPTGSVRSPTATMELCLIYSMTPLLLPTGESCSRHGRSRPAAARKALLGTGLT